MNRTLTVLAASLMLVTGAAGARAGCVTGAVVGGVAGHVAGHHALAGAAAGCLVGHELSQRKKRRLEAERAERARQHQQGYPAPH